MKILLVGPVYPFRGGIAQHTARLACALRDSGHDTRLATFRRLYPRMLYPGHSDRVPLQGRPNSFRDPAQVALDPWLPWTWKRTADEAARAGPDLALFQWWTPFLSLPYTALAARLRRAGVRTVFLVHNALPHEPGLLDVPLARLALRQADAFLVHAEGEREALRALLPAAPPAALCPHPLVDFPGMDGLPRDAARAALGLPARGVVLLFFGFVRAYKGLDVLIDALGLLRSAGEPVPFLLAAGEFWLGVDRYRRQAARLGLADCIRLDDRYIPDEEVGRYFAAADFFAAPYRSATQSGALKLAMARGLPLIATHPAVDELARAWPALQVVPPGDPRALAHAIRVWMPVPPARLQPPDPCPSWRALVSAIERLA